MNREQLMNVLIAPHVTEKTSLAMQNHNQYTFRVRRDATKTDIKKAVELMFEVKVAGVQVVNEPGKSRRFGKTRRPHAGLEEGLREPRQGPVDRLRSPGERLIGNIHMALIKYKPTSPGTRAVVKVDRSHLHKGGPYLPLTGSQNKTGARNHAGRITTRHVGGGSRQKYRIIDFKRDKDGIAGVVERLEYDPNRTSHIALVKYADGERRYILAPKGVKSGRRDPLRRRFADQGGQRHAAAPHPGRLHRPQRRDEAGQGRSARPQRRQLRRRSRRAKASTRTCA